VSGNERKCILEKCRESFSFSDIVHIYTHTFQYQCNISLNCNEQYKEGIGHIRVCNTESL